MSSDTAIPAQHGKPHSARKGHMLHDWSEKRDFSHDAIKQAVNKVGPTVKDIARDLRNA
jgi:hypothetical protein